MKSKINIKLLFFLFALLFLVLAIITIRSTYARYITSVASGGSAEMGSWFITVNNQDILTNSDLSNIIIPVLNKANEEDEYSEYIAQDKIAPTTVGYVEITLDYSKVTVPFRYDILFSPVSNTLLEDFTLTSYSIDGAEEIEIEDSSNPISAIIYPNDTTRQRTLKLNFEWFDGEGESYDDIADTAYSRENDEIGLRFNLEFTQLPSTT